MTADSPRNSQPHDRTFWLYAGCAVIALHALLVVGLFRDYGMSWDQPSSHGYGEAVVRFYTTLGGDRTAQTHWLHPYGGLFEVSAALVEWSTGMQWFEARTLTTGLFGLVGVIAVLRAGWVLFAPRVGVTAAVLLWLTPAYFGHQFINPKDLPFAALSMLALRYIAQLATETPVWSWRTVLQTGGAIGAALGIRVGGLMLFGALAVGVATGFLLNRSHPALRNASTWRRGVLQAFILVGIAWSIMVLFWPYAYSAPISGPILALKEFSHFWWDGRVFYDGKMLAASELPWTYIPNLLVRTLPEAVLLGLTGGVVTACLARIRAHGLRSPSRLIATVTMLGAFLLPVAAIWILHSRIYDGLRHVLFIFPPLVLLAAVGLWASADRLPTRWAAGWWATAGLFTLVTVVDLRALHPYQYIYFNRAVGGGVATANRDYDLDFWATGLREAAEWIAQYYNPTPGQPVLYSAGAEPEQVDQFLRPLSGAVFRRAAAGEKARIFLLIRRGRQHVELTWGRTLHTVSRDGVPLVDIVEAP